MLIKLCNTTFLRRKHKYIYIYNQLSYAERYYSEDSYEFLESLKKEIRSLDDILNELFLTFNVEREILRKDYLEFIHDLEKDGFVLTAESFEEIRKREPFFSYNKSETVDVCDKTEDNYNVYKGINELINKKDDVYIENLYLELTRHCNEKCIHCYIPQNQRSNKRYISLSEAKRYLDQAKDLGFWQITLTGGEPFLHPQINEILKYAREKDVIISVLSNLTVLTTKHIDVLKQVYISHIQVSLYSLKEEIHDSITNLAGSHQKTLQAIELCYKNNIPLQINCPVIDKNKNDYKDVLSFAKSRGMKANTDLNIMARTDFTKENMKNTLSEQNIKSVYTAILHEDREQLKILQQVVLKNIEINVDLSKHICGAAFNTLFISAEGKVYPCATWQSYELGDLNRETLRDIFLYGTASNIVRNIKLEDYYEVANLELFYFMKICPAHNANSFDGDYTKLPDDVFVNAKLKFDSIKESINK